MITSYCPILTRPAFTDSIGKRRVIRNVPHSQINYKSGLCEKHSVSFLWCGYYLKQEEVLRMHMRLDIAKFPCYKHNPEPVRNLWNTHGTMAYLRKKFILDLPEEFQSAVAEGPEWNPSRIDCYKVSNPGILDVPTTYFRSGGKYFQA